VTCPIVYETDESGKGIHLRGENLEHLGRHEGGNLLEIGTVLRKK